MNTYTDGVCIWTLADLTDPESWGMSPEEARRVDDLEVGGSVEVDGGEGGRVTLRRVS